MKDVHINLDTIVPVLSSGILRSAWVDSDAIVQQAMWEPLLMFLKGGVLILVNISIY